MHVLVIPDHIIDSHLVNREYLHMTYMCLYVKLDENKQKLHMTEEFKILGY